MIWLLVAAFSVAVVLVAWPAHMLVIIRREQIEQLKRIDAVMGALKCLFHQGRQQMYDLSEITGKVEKIMTVGDSMKALMLEFKAALDAAGTDPVALKALADAMEAKSEEWAAAVLANTPASQPLPN